MRNRISEIHDDRPGIELYPVTPPGDPRPGPGEHDRPVPKPIEVPPPPATPHPNAEPVEVPTEPRAPTPMRRGPRWNGRARAAGTPSRAPHDIERALR